MHSNVFLKGYQWPFDSRKVVGGSSIIDILVYIETVVRGPPRVPRFPPQSGRVPLRGPQPRGPRLPDQVEGPARHAHRAASGDEPRRDRSSTPITASTSPPSRWRSPSAPSTTTAGWPATAGGSRSTCEHLFPVGEVNGSHGVYRPGGSALNAGQVGSLRAAEYIANRYADWQVDPKAVEAAAAAAVGDLLAWIDRCVGGGGHLAGRARGVAAADEPRRGPRPLGRRGPQGRGRGLAAVPADRRLRLPPRRRRAGRGAAQPPPLLRPRRLPRSRPLLRSKAA